MAHRVGQQIAGYRLIQYKGSGASGDVYLAESAQYKQPVAVKMLNLKLTNPREVRVFINEASMIFRLTQTKHPHIVQLLAFDIAEDDTPFLVMTYASNGTLLKRHPRGTPLPLLLAVSYMKQLASALQYAHEQHVIHRDIKPENILLGEDDKILLSDFGIAVVAHNTSTQRTEDIVGTWAYMAPEQLQGKPRPASDQYSLGIVVYEWLCGERPFRGSLPELYHQHLSVPPPPLREKISTIPPEVEHVVLRALDKDPQRRFASVQDFAMALEKASIPSRSIFLFGYETSGGKKSIFWNNPHLFSPDDTYQQWAKTKRSFTKEELLRGLWVKVGDHTYSFIVRFLPDGRFTESPLFEPDRELRGSWKLVNGVIRMNIGQYENGTFVQYELDIFANRENTMHSGIEFMQGRQIPHAYFKVFHTHQCNERLESELTMSLLRYKHHDAARYLDEARSRLGSPLTSVFEASPSLLGTSGRVQRFTGGPDDPQGASVYSSKYGTYPIWGWITECHERCGGTSGRLGFPTSPELDAWPSPQGTTGQVQRFEGGPHDAWPVGGDEWDYSKGVSVYSSPHGAFPVWGGIGICYEHLGGTGSAFGFPTSPELTAIASPQGTMGWVQRFEGGDMYWCDAYDGIPVEQPILTIFEKSGGSGGKFGFPKSPAVSDPVHPYHYIQEFEGGVIQSFYQSSTQ